MSGTGSSNLRKAKIAQDDEFYTQLSDIENELKHYKQYFKGKIIYCNCDDPYESNFFKYFAMNFNFLGLKKLIATSYATSPIAHSKLNLLGERSSYKIEINKVYDANGDGAEDLADVEQLLREGKGENKLTPLKGDGDFRSKESIELLKQADIVVTNPPFSLFREYITQLEEYHKKYIIIGNKNAAAYKCVFPLLNKNQIWLGYSSPSEFMKPDGSITKKVKGLCRWFTNLGTPKEVELLILYKKYSPEEYIKYDNFDGINIEKVADIPMDYDGNMGVPITFIDSFNSSQFEIIGAGTGDTAKEIGVTKNYRGRTDLAITKNGVHTCPFNRIIIRHKK